MATGIKLSFGNSKSLALKPKATTAFGSFDDDANPSKSSKPLTTNLAPSRLQKQKQAEAQAIDSSVFEYDEVYDNIKAAEKLMIQKRTEDSADRKPKYVEGLLRTAEIRKQDRIRAEDKLMERERLKEGDEFVEKDAFVTPAYQKQQEELRKAEEEEKLKEASAKGIAKGGMAAFYANYLDTASASRQAAVQAASAVGPKPIQGPTPKPADFDSPTNEIDLAKEASQRLGHLVELNEDGEIVDKRELLAGGLNVSLPNKSGVSLLGLAGNPAPGGFAVPISQRKGLLASGVEGPTESVTNADSARRGFESRQRLSEQIEQQMMEANERKRKVLEEESANSKAKMVKRNDESRIEELKRKALERRQAKAHEV